MKVFILTRDDDEYGDITIIAAEDSTLAFDMLVKIDKGFWPSRDRKISSTDIKELPFQHNGESTVIYKHSWDNR